MNRLRALRLGLERPPTSAEVHTELDRLDQQHPDDSTWQLLLELAGSD